MAQAYRMSRKSGYRFSEKDMRKRAMRRKTKAPALRAGASEATARAAVD
jgi:hypothetical protein